MGRLIDANEIKKREKDVVLANGAKHRCFDTTMLSEIPTVDAEPVRYGRWQVNEVNGYKDMTCLSCGWLFEYYDGLEEEWNYCPHCGAKMAECEAVLRWTKGEVDAEPTEEQIKEYCRKRCLVIVTSELFNEMKARWSAETVRHGRWETVFMSEATGYDPTLANYIDTVFCHRCSVCKEDARLDEFGEEMISKYCPNCGAKMDEHIDTPTDPVAK